MSADKYELQDVSVKYHSESNNSLNTSTAGTKEDNMKKGMYISTAKAFILAFLAIAIAVLVGIIVHFAGSKTVECNCNYPTVKTPTSSEALEQCVNLATEGNNQICYRSEYIFSPTAQIRMESRGPSSTKWKLTKSENGRSSSVENGDIKFKTNGMTTLTKLILFVFGIITIAGVLASVVMLGVLVRDKDNNRNNIGNNAGDSGAQVGETTTKSTMSSACPVVTCPTVPSTGTTASPGATTPTTTPTPEVLDVRLPDDLEPILYTVELQPNMYEGEPSGFTFNGSVSIEIRCKTLTSRIHLHMKKLNITSDISVKEQNGIVEFYSSHSMDEEREFLIIDTLINMRPGAVYIVSMSFVGPLVADLAGLYLSSYKRGNETIYITTSQMQATDARKTFPCYDEPAIKAKFDVTLVRKSHMQALSNMPIVESVDRYLATSLLAAMDARKVFPCMDEPALKAQFDVTLLRKATKIALSNMPVIKSEERGNGWIADRFNTTPIMSTYLLALIVCDFNYTSNVTANGIEYRAWARPEAIDQTPYSLKVGVDILTYFEDFFNVPYPLQKQDMIAIPDFAAGAMENWGLITYRETAMLYQPGVSSEGNKQRVAVVVSHELAHQWFGNLVTPSWWDDLWLNEGFASYVEYMGVDHVHQDWLMFDQFVVGDLQDVFNFDGLISSHPLYVPVNHPDEISEIFDRISYAKGATVIRMMRFFLGDSVFQNGLTRYLKELEYGAAFHDDLWFALGNQSVAENGMITDVKGIMDTWVLQMNYPTVKVAYTTAGQISLSQSRYLRDYNATDPGKFVSPFGYKWDIPFTYTTSTQRRFNVTNEHIVLMGRNAGTVMVNDMAIIPDPEGNNGKNWVIGNCQQYGYYRVNYDERNWNALMDQLEEDHTVIPPVNRAQIINDAWNLARSSDLDIRIPLRTTVYMANETEYVPWSAVSSEIGFVSAMLQRDPLYGELRKYLNRILTDPFGRIGMNNTGASHLESYTRSTVVGLACSYDIQECKDEAVSLFRQWMTDENNNPIDPGIKSTVYCTAIAEGGIEEWEFALRRYKTENLAAEKVRLQSALACSKETWVLSKYLKMAIDANEIRRQDAVSVIVAVSRNTIGRSLAWDFFRENWDFFLTDFGAGSFSFSNLISGVTSSFNTQFELNQLQEFIAGKDDLGSGQRAFEQALEKTAGNIQWMDRNYATIRDWLAERNA